MIHLENTMCNTYDNQIRINLPVVVLSGRVELNTMKRKGSNE